MTDWDDIWDREPNDPITDDGLAYLRGQVADRMADVAVGPLIARIDAVEAQRDRLREVLKLAKSLIDNGRFVCASDEIDGTLKEQPPPT